jgi:hypothetical protein
MRTQGLRPFSVRLRLVIDEAVSQRRVVSYYLCTGPRRCEQTEGKLWKQCYHLWFRFVPVALWAAGRSLSPGSAPLRRDIMLLGASAAYPHFPQRREASRGGPRSPRLLFFTAFRKLVRQTPTATGAPLR